MKIKKYKKSELDWFNPGYSNPRSDVLSTLHFLHSAHWIIAYRTRKHLTAKKSLLTLLFCLLSQIYSLFSYLQKTLRTTLFYGFPKIYISTSTLFTFQPILSVCDSPTKAALKLCEILHGSSCRNTSIQHL